MTPGLRACLAARRARHHLDYAMLTLPLAGVVPVAEAAARAAQAATRATWATARCPAAQAALRHEACAEALVAEAEARRALGAG